MPLICRFIKTGEIINDFQASAKGGILIKNAVSNGLAKVDELEEIVVTEEEYDAIMKKYFKDHPPEPKQPNPDMVSFFEKLKKLGITEGELKSVFGKT